MNKNNPRYNLYYKPWNYRQNRTIIDLVLSRIPSDTGVSIEPVGYFYTHERLLERHRIKRAALNLKDYLLFLSDRRIFDTLNRLIYVLEDETDGVDVSGFIVGGDPQEVFRECNATPEGRGRLVNREYKGDLVENDNYLIEDLRAIPMGAAATTLALIGFYFQILAEEEQLDICLRNPKHVQTNKNVFDLIGGMIPNTQIVGIDPTSLLYNNPSHLIIQDYLLLLISDNEFRNYNELVDLLEAKTKERGLTGVDKLIHARKAASVGCAANMLALLGTHSQTVLKESEDKYNDVDITQLN